MSAERVFLAADDLADASIFALKHPRTGSKLQFARTPGRLLEIQRFAEAATEPRSWLLVGGQDRVLQDGSLFLATPMDPLFMLLPQLLQARGTTDGERRGYFQPLSDVITGDDAAELVEHVCTLPRLVEQLRAVCDVNDKYDEPMLRYNDQKVLGWLRRKVAAVRRHLAANASAAAEASGEGSQFSEPCHAQFSTKVGAPGAPQAAAADERSTLVPAIALVCEYVPAELQGSLAASYGVGDDQVSDWRGKPKKAVADAADENEEPSKWRAACAAEAEERRAEEPAPKKPKAAPKPAAPAPLKKGQKTMASFFGKK